MTKRNAKPVELECESADGSEIYAPHPMMIRANLASEGKTYDDALAATPENPLVLRDGTKVYVVGGF